MNDNVKKLAAEISKLSLIEISQLVEEISSVCGIDLNALLQDTSSNASIESEEKEAPKEKVFTVKLVGFDQTKKAEMIKIVRQILGSGISLSEVKSLIESLPAVIKKNVKEKEKDEVLELFSKTEAKLEVSED